MQRGRYAPEDDDDADEGFERPPPETEELAVMAKSLDQNMAAYSSVLLPAPRRKDKSFSCEKPLLKLAAVESFRNQKAPSHRRISSYSLQKTALPAEAEQSSPTYEREGSDCRPNRIKQKMLKMQSQVAMEEIMDSVVFKTKRTQVGEDLAIRADRHGQEAAIQEQMDELPHSTLIYRQRPAPSTHSFFKRLMRHKQCDFVESKYNLILKQKLQKSKHKPEQQPKQTSPIDFRADLQSGNLDHCIRASENDYHLYLRVDTNTKGHQNWFHFQTTNHDNQTRRINICICNLKRRFKMVDIGQKIYVKRTESGWEKLDEDVELQAVDRKMYKLSFSLTFEAHQQLIISLIPSYTYSQMLKHIESCEKSPNAKVDILTHSLTGLAIPMLTITSGVNQKKSKDHNNKKLLLISARIHPSETCSSFIIKALIDELLSSREDIEQLLSTTVIKIVPMLNPDGVVFGNFRTNYLGDDLNRAFQHSDDAIYPQTVALKQLGRVCKLQFGDNFMGFLDFHGHSTQTNSFVYGPQYEQGSDDFVQCRILPKLIEQSSRYFDYRMSSFKLQDYKFNTARGYFLKKLKVPAYTIETSYALYYTKENQTVKEMSIKEWQHFGTEVCTSIAVYCKYVELEKSKKMMKPAGSRPKDGKKTIQGKSNQEANRNRARSFSFQSYQQIKRQILKEASQFQDKKEKIDKRQNKDSKDNKESQSDGESAEEDLNNNERQILVKKVKEVVFPSFLLPRVLKPAVLLPSVVPSIIILGKRDFKQMASIPKQTIGTKYRNKRYNRPLNISHEYTEFLINNAAGLSSLRPDVINFANLRKPKLTELHLEEHSSML